MFTEKFFLYRKDFTEAGNDKFFIFDGHTLSEKTPHEICSDDSILICHDYWLIAPSLINKTNSLPQNAVDIYEFNYSIAGDGEARQLREKSDIKNIATICPSNINSPEFEAEVELINHYFDIFYKKKEWDSSVYCKMAALIFKKWGLLKEKATQMGELSRFFDVEIPIFNILYQHVCHGIKINEANLREHKRRISHKYYSQLKNFSKKFSLPLEAPSDNTVIEHLEDRGYDFANYSVEHILSFVPTPDNFSDDVINIRRISSSRAVLSSITYSQKKCTPIVDIFGSKTSRIYFKDPTLQNISKEHRDIITTETGNILSYVDYDQFEVGIMAALSEDPLMMRIYKEQDMYQHLANVIFCDPMKRKFSKRLFLSYAYGMRLHDIASAAESLGANKHQVKEFFRSFKTFENWKKQIHQRFFDEGSIGTINGNFLRRQSNNPLTEKEKRSCVSQVVQGTASLIFKKALINIHNEGGFRILLPMHDAVLVEHTSEKDPSILIEIFSKVMSDTLDNKITGKASLENFFKV